MKKKLLIFIIIILAIILVLFSFFKFNVYNPISAFSGIIKILFSEVEYVVVQEKPAKVIFAKPDIAIFEKYMEDNGYKCLEEDRMGSIYVYKNDTHEVTIQFSMNQYYSKWIWKFDV